MKRYYLPVKELKRLIWLQNFAGKISGYATKYGINAATVDDVKDGYAWLAYWMNYRKQFQEYLKKLSTFKDEIMSGIGSASVEPTPPGFGATPNAVAPGVFTWVASLVAIIKANLF